MIFLDTSAIYALADRSDANHDRAKRQFAHILKASWPVVTHNYVLVESFALLQHRLGRASAVALQESSRAFEVVWIDEDLHSEAASRWSRGRRSFSFVDQVSFVLMERRRIEVAFAFDPDFVKAGFRLSE
jgi:predicted nucleic acid-binding protein